jgi:Fe2+ or Zn2+ uptake regulation protein
MRREKIEKYIVKHKLRVTKERTKLIDLLCEVDVFKMKDFLSVASEHGISHGTVYLFVEMATNAGVMRNQEAYVFKK